jgi:hypothetical protein
MIRTRIVLLMGMLACATIAHADLAVICTAGGAAGKSPATCTALKYDIPKATDLVRKGTSWADFVLTPFGDLKPTDTLDVCASNLPAPTTSPVPYTTADPCQSFAQVLASTMATTPSLPLRWERPTTNANGTPLLNLLGFRLVYGTTADALNQTVEIKDPNQLSYTLTGLAYGSTYFVAVKAFDATGESDKSNTVSKTMPSKPEVPTKPNAPVLSIVETQAYNLVQSEDLLTLVAIGTVPLTTACNAKVTAMGLYAVPRAKVTLASGAVRPKVVLAKCG